MILPADIATFGYLTNRLFRDMIIAVTVLMSVCLVVVGSNPSDMFKTGYGRYSKPLISIVPS